MGRRGSLGAVYQEEEPESSSSAFWSRPELGNTHLKLLGPLLDIFVVLASVLGVEVGECAGVLSIVPDLSKNTGIDVAHENLADRVKAVCYISQI